MRWLKCILLMLLMFGHEIAGHAANDVLPDNTVIPGLTGDLTDGSVDVSHMLFGHIGDSYGWHNRLERAACHNSASVYRVQQGFRLECVHVLENRARTLL